MTLSFHIEIDYETGDYEIEVKNLTEPGVPIEADPEMLASTIKAVVDNWTARLTAEGLQGPQ